VEEYSGGIVVAIIATMADSRLHIDERAVDDVTILTLTGEMRLDDGDLVFRRKIHELLDQRRVKILVDLGGVSSIDSSGVGMMAAKLKTVRESGGDLRLLHLNARGHRLFTLAKLRTAFETFEDEASALRSFAWRPKT
jgi:anti-sigma B factor antagonist